MSNSNEQSLEQSVIAALEQSVAVSEQTQKWQADLREGKNLPASSDTPDWPSLKARIAALKYRPDK